MSCPLPDITVDVSGSYCPVPIIETAKAVKQMASSQVLLVIASDPGVESDMEAYCKSTGNDYLGIEREGQTLKLWIRVKRSSHE